MAKDEINKNLEEAKEQLNEFQGELGNVNEQLQSIGISIGSAITSQLKNANELTEKLAKKYKTDIESSIRRASNGLDNYTKLQNKINNSQDASKELEKEKAKLEKERTLTLRRIEFLQRNGVQLDIEDVANLEEGFSLNQKILNNLENQNTEKQKSLSLSTKLLGGADGILNRIDKTGNLSKILNLDKIQKSFGAINKLSAGLKKSTYQNLSTFEELNLKSRAFVGNIDKAALRSLAFGAALKLTTKVAKELDIRISNIRKEFGLSFQEANKLNFELTNTFGDLAANVENILKANSALNKSLGDTAVIFNEEIRESAAATQFRLQLSEEAIGNLGKLALASGKQFKETELTQARAAISAEKEFGIRLKLRNVLEEANQITGALRINTERIPGGLSKAVAVAKSLGTEFKTIADAAGTLLDFESSIQKELEAELLIGRDLNLEKARLLALNGDIEGVTRELVAQTGSLEELQGMNVLQQQALAGALGLSSDQLSDILLNQKSLNAVAEEGLNRDAERVLEQEKSLSIQQNLNLVVEKFNDLLKIAIAALIGLTVGLGAFLLPFIGVGALGAAAIGGAAALTAGGIQSIGDGISPPGRGPFTITDSYGKTAVTAQGDGVVVSPNISQGSSNVEAKRTNQLLEALLNKPAPKVQMDSIEVGTVVGMSAFSIQ